MRAVFLITLGILELVVCGALVYMGEQLPGRGAVEGTFGKAERVTRQASQQIFQVRDQVGLLRQERLGEVAGNLQAQLRQVTRTLREHRVDFETVQAIRAALGGVTDGLEGAAAALDPAGVDRFGEGLGLAADFLDKELVPAAEDAARQMHKATAELRADAELTAEFFKHLPSDFKALRDLHDGLAAFDQGLGKMGVTLQPQRFEEMRGGFEGMYTALRTGAEEVERVSAFTYPVVTFDGLTPEVEQRRFWPQGAKIAGGLEKAGRGVRAADAQLREMVESLPEMQASLEASRKVIAATRRTLANALAQEDRIKPVLEQLPAQAGRLAESLPAVGEEFAALLRETAKLREVAAALRKAKDGLRGATRGWPATRQTVLASAKLLRGTDAQLRQALEHQREYEDAVEQTAVLADGLATVLPILSQKMLNQLEDQEASLGELGDGLGEMGAVLPEYGAMTGRLVETARWLLRLVAALVLLHGCYLLLSVLLPGAPPAAGQAAG